MTTCSSLARSRRGLLPSLATVILLSGGVSGVASAQDGLLDLGFGRPGVFTPFGSQESNVKGVRVQPDGRIIAAGYATVGDDDTLFALARYNADGTIDTSFGNAGKTVTPFGSDYGAVIALALQADGRIVAVGYSFTPGPLGSEDIALARYNADGTLDATFGRGGRLITDIPDADAAAYDVSIDDEGRIVLLGLATSNYATPDGSTLVIARYRTDGSLDPSFGDGGIARVFPHDSFGGVPGRIQPDGTVLAAEFNYRAHRLRVSRLNRDGAVDTTFNGGRPIEADLPAEVLKVNLVSVQADGKLVVLGFGVFATAFDRSGRVDSNSSDIFLARLNPDGTRDSRFGRDGIMVTDVPLAGGPTRNTPSKELVIQRDGKLLVGCTAVSPSNDQSLSALLRYGADGELDPSFGNNGVIIASYSDPSRTPYQAEASTVAVQDDGKIILAGRAIAPGGDRTVFDFSVLRFENASIRPAPAAAAAARAR